MMMRLKAVVLVLFGCVALGSAVPIALADQGSPGAAAPQAAPVHLRGTISDFNAISITIKTKDGDVKAVRTTEDTKYYVNGKPVAQRPDLDKGERISVLARQEQDGSLTALRVNLSPRKKSDRARVVGTISDFNAISLTIKTKDGDVKAVRLTEDTKYFVNGKPVSQRPEFDKGQHVAVLAHVEQDGSLTALRVNLAQRKPGDRVRLAGTVSDFNAISLTIKTKDGDVKAVRLTEDTKYFVNGKPVNDRPQFDKGERVNVLAHVEQDGSLTALRVAVRTS